MSFLLGQMRLHLNGQKELTAHKDFIKIDAPSVVKVPLVNGNVLYNVLVNEGDEVKVGTKIAERNDHFYVPIYSPVSGVVKGVEKVITSTLKPSEHLVIENNGKYEELLPLKPLDFEVATCEELTEFVKQAGIVGCGGAGFPTFVKYNSPKNIETLIINAVECEPFITTDYQMVDNNMNLFVTGVRAMFKMSKAKETLVAIKETKKDLIVKLQEAFKGYEGIKVALVPDVYPMGWERTLVYQLTKKRYDRLPAEAGCIVSNATSAIAFADALVNGNPITKKLVTVSGDGIKEPTNVLCFVGTPVKDLISACGGYTSEEAVVIGGGPMMGKAVTSDEFVITSSTNAITVLKPQKTKEIACLRCGRCSDHCPAGLQPVRINEANKIQDTVALDKLRINDCIECGLCTFVCPSKIEVTEGIRRAKRYMALKAKK